jgi:hypothetical protein
VWGARWFLSTILIETVSKALSILYSGGLNYVCNLDTNARFIWRKKMDKTLRNILIVLAIIVVAAGLFYGGMLFNRMSAWYGGYGPGGMMMGGGYGRYQNGQQGNYGPGGMMGSGGGMMMGI